jgi:hypothetical protein
LPVLDAENLAYKERNAKVGISMGQRIYQEHIGGTAAHVGDCLVWAEIYYLDSPTDYREYLPNHHRQPVRIDSQLVMLDSAVPKPTFARILFAACVPSLSFFSRLRLRWGVCETLGFTGRL